MKLIEWQNPAWSERKKPFSLSLLISFYNKLTELRLVLASCEMQSFKNFEILICDDGSRGDVVDQIKKEWMHSELAIRHLWQEDIGFRKNRIMNNAILRSQSEYLVFLDGDTMVHPEFIREHYENRELGRVLSGRSMELTPGVSGELTPEKVKSGYIQKNIFWIILKILHQKDSNGLKGIYFKHPFWREYFNKKRRPIVGRNFSLHKSDIERVNGFNMDYEGVGIGEDSDLDYRLSLMGIKTKSVVANAIQYHLYHRLQKRDNANHEIFDRTRTLQEAVTKNGLRELRHGN